MSVLIFALDPNQRDRVSDHRLYDGERLVDTHLTVIVFLFPTRHAASYAL